MTQDKHRTRLVIVHSGRGPIPAHSYHSYHAILCHRVTCQQKERQIWTPITASGRQDEGSIYMYTHKYHIIDRLNNGVVVPQAKHSRKRELKVRCLQAV